MPNPEAMQRIAERQRQGYRDRRLNRIFPDFNQIPVAELRRATEESREPQADGSVNLTWCFEFQVPSPVRSYFVMKAD